MLGVIDVSKEYEDYRDILESLNLHFQKHWVYPKEVGGYLGMDYRTVMKKFSVDRQGCSIETLARRMSRGA